jgi:hypothetical protein
MIAIRIIKSIPCLQQVAGYALAGRRSRSTPLAV